MWTSFLFGCRCEFFWKIALLSKASPHRSKESGRWKQTGTLLRTAANYRQCPRDVYQTIHVVLLRPVKLGFIRKPGVQS